MIGLGAALLAIIYLVDNEETQRWARVCMNWVGDHHYQLIGVVVDETPTGEKWRSVVQMLADGSAQVCVVPRWDHMSRERIPRVEVIAEDLARDESWAMLTEYRLAPAAPRQRRAKRHP
ncbi:hypothetical protein [Phytohabitans rumicis]|uniref:Uncharacterized protein n=1 Tax=Phytohabitans rumicis TaxID=1076125 RepID=A0A6V8L2T1_9ACTN|nr:hypothetical protein [Phytohabitans rumicis]GFJ91593.1 hypothetical protein Prum_052350 [Phytohabitans rumicis]